MTLHLAQAQVYFDLGRDFKCKTFQPYPSKYCFRAYRGLLLNYYLLFGTGGFLVQ